MLGICGGFYMRNTSFGSHLGNKLFAAYKAFQKGKLENYKLVLIVRDDLGMSRGKIAAQCSHASVMAYKNATLYNPEAAQLWEAYAQAKVVLKTDNEKSLLALYEAAKTNGICASLVCDAGRTEVASGSKTVIAIGPGPKDAIDKITGHLKLL
ncbi:hypothetical protein JTE90_015379 [Oedothorax gibbosus]|uniref:peptidyl-tRNA hydrolase n=1 Tax=Oedothorax gibbosus TaxID=931172 RepID=A0AAV6U5B3_9ARAC|nr:hypothetical protein JTE90_015379 [Oedothorax gibbosus]